MNLVTVLPIISIKKLGNLSYFSSLNLEIGDLVEININNRKLEAIVIKIEDLKNAKQEVRSQDFSIKKITNVIQKSAISKDILKSIESAAYSVGSGSANILDKLIMNSLIREIKFDNKENKNGNSIVYFSPTIFNLKKYHQEYIDKNKENKNKTVIFHSELSAKKQIENIEKIKTLDEVIIFCTPSLLPLIKPNLSEVNILDEGSRHYKSFLEGLDMNIFLQRLFSSLNIKVNLIDEVLSLNSYMSNSDLIQNKKELKVNLVQMNDRDNKQKSIYISDVLETRIKNIFTKNKNAKVFLYSQRKGAYSSIICEDCGDLYNIGEIKKQDIKVSGTDTNDELKCKICDSYRLKTLGVGTNGVHEYLLENLEKLNIDKSKIYIIDSETTKTKTQIQKVYDEFQKTGGILIGTEIALQVLDNIDLIGIISLDTLFNIPDYTLDYEIYRLVNNMSNCINENSQRAVFQTRRKQKIFAKDNGIDNFIDRELDNRKKMLLPPYYTFISFDMPEDYEKLPSIFGKEKFFTKKFKVKNKNTFNIVNRFLVILENNKFEKLKESIYENLYTYNLRINTSSLNY